MADMFLSADPIISARVVLPRVGVFYCELTVDTETAPQGLQTFRTADGALSLTGTVRSDRTAVYGARAELLLIGGRDGLSTILEPREYSDPTIRILLSDICRETGEVLSDTIDPAILNGTVGRWCRTECVAGSAIADIANATGCAWRILNDGSLWIGLETWPNVEIPGDIVEERPRDGVRELQVETLFATLAPGTTWDDRRVSLVEHRANADQATTIAWFDPQTPRDPEARDRLKVGFDALVTNITRSTRYHALYPATVLGQSGDGSVDLQLDSPLLPALVRVPVRSGTPGTSTEVSNGARCLVAFEGGEPNGPVVVAWVVSSHETQHTIDAPSVKIGANATRGIARLNDAVARNAALATWMASVEASLGALFHPVTPFSGSDIATISSASSRGKCD